MHGVCFVWKRDGCIYIYIGETDQDREKERVKGNQRVIEVTKEVLLLEKAHISIILTTIAPTTTTTTTQPSPSGIYCASTALKSSNAFGHTYRQARPLLPPNSPVIGSEYVLH